jgi:Concanavalin A-like lectin/glucanases superfamily
MATFCMHALVVAAFAALVSLAPTSALSGSLNFLANRPGEYDFLDIPKVPPSFGSGEFALDLWIKPDTNYPVGGVWRGSYEQLTHWSDADPEPYSSDDWWLSGNWLLDGHTRPEGFLGGNTREGTLSLQFYGGGRLRLMFADAKLSYLNGMVYAVQAWPAATTPSLLDGQWHHVMALRRWRQPSGASLELWIDGAMVAATPIPLRTNMSQFWRHLAHPDDPDQLGGWSIGSEVMTAWNYALTQYEDYKGLVDSLRFWGRAPTGPEIQAMATRQPYPTLGLLAHFDFDRRHGASFSDRIDPSYQLTLFRQQTGSISTNDGPG